MPTLSGREELFLSAAYAEALRAAGYGTPQRFLFPAAAELVRRLPGRANWRFTVHQGGRPLTVFLKRHAAGGGARPPGVTEWDNHALLRDHGVAVPEPVAAGQTPDGASFFCSRCLDGALPLDRHLADAGRRDRRLPARLGGLVRKLHRIPLCHRDLYLCHVFLRPADRSLFLIDLQRVLGRPGGRLRSRWLVKDLAALLHSSALPGVTRSDRLRFLLAYLGQQRSDAATRAWARRISRKARRLGRHVPRFDGRGRPRS